MFINPEFYLYNAPRDLPAFFPTQLNRYKNKLLSFPSHLSERHNKLAQKLVSLHQNESPYARYPEYRYERLKKGMTCINGDALLTNFNKHFLICNKCGYMEDIESAVLRNVEELVLLFPERKITVTTIEDWCQIVSKKTIRRILSKNFKEMGQSSATYYIKP